MFRPRLLIASVPAIAAVVLCATPATAQNRAPAARDAAVQAPPAPPPPPADSDHDGFPDREDVCPDRAVGPHADRLRPGCPADDSDGDGLFDPEDACPLVVPGPMPDPDRRGCPVPDGDHDGIPDSDDHCPDQAGSPTTRFGQNGCPGAVRLHDGQLVASTPIPFSGLRVRSEGRDTLKDVADAMNALPAARFVVEVYVSDGGDAAAAQQLTEQRAQAVITFLGTRGVPAARLTAQGRGGADPVAPTAGLSGAALATARERNERVVFRVVYGTAPAAAAGN